MPSMKIFLSKDTINMFEQKLETSIDRFVKGTDIHKSIVWAIIEQESDKNPLAIRYEKHLKEKLWYTRHIPRKYKNNELAYCSMGYMQVLYGIAKSYGFEGSPSDLLDSDHSIEYGTHHLKQLIKKYNNLEDAISSYNQGKPRKIKGKYKNQAYVDSVMNKIKKYNKKFNTQTIFAAKAARPQKRSVLQELLSLISKYFFSSPPERDNE